MALGSAPLVRTKHLNRSGRIRKTRLPRTAVHKQVLSRIENRAAVGLRSGGAAHHLGAYPTNQGDIHVAAGAFGGFGFTVAEHMVGGNVICFHEVGDQFLDRFHLSGTGVIDVKVAHQADADAVFVELIAGGFVVGAPLLLGPAGPDFDPAVGGIGAVADDKVIAELVPPLGFVHFVEGGGPSRRGGAVVNDDPVPMIERCRRDPCRGKSLDRGENGLDRLHLWAGRHHDPRRHRAVDERGAGEVRSREVIYQGNLRLLLAAGHRKQRNDEKGAPFSHPWPLSKMHPNREEAAGGRP